MRTNRPALLLASWTLLVWTTRIRNIWTDDELSLAGQLGRTAISLVFTGFAVATLVLLRRPSLRRPVVAALAAWTTVVWLVRAVQIALVGHSAAFVAVHLVLAVVSVALAGWAWRTERATAAAPTQVRAAA